MGKPIAVGIRPEALDDAGRTQRRRRRPPARHVQAVEALGPEQLAHVEVDAKPVLVEEVIEGLVDMEQADELAEIMPDADGDHATSSPGSMRRRASGPTSRSSSRSTSASLHFFDLASGEAIGG